MQLCNWQWLMHIRSIHRQWSAGIKRLVCNLKNKKNIRYWSSKLYRGVIYLGPHSFKMYFLVPKSCNGSYPCPNEYLLDLLSYVTWIWQMHGTHMSVAKLHLKKAIPFPYDLAWIWFLYENCSSQWDL
jgi:hypothetical protein